MYRSLGIISFYRVDGCGWTREIFIFGFMWYEKCATTEDVSQTFGPITVGTTEPMRHCVVGFCLLSQKPIKIYHFFRFHLRQWWLPQVIFTNLRICSRDENRTLHRRQRQSCYERIEDDDVLWRSTQMNRILSRHVCGNVLRDHA